MTMLIQAVGKIKPKKASVTMGSLEHLRNEVEPKLSPKKSEKIFGKSR